ncbi:iron-containing alcohol dehydrogenase [Acidaminobacter sp. JC074]|uniref:iron-containing alcohol dehydrogenase n=1 Tax=Acidaminobacter sp. JC074 TaxID=2530199 RepID=UPI001F0D63EC|nr:iron-containing alcohol dehydrogenase [Acidaminobacter sp. JC074]
MKKYYNPVEINFVESVDEVISALEYENGKCLMIIQDNIKVMCDLRETFRKKLIEAGITVDIFNSIRPNPLYSDIDKGIQVIKEGNYDFLLAIGGGSTLDSAKVMAFSNKYDIRWQEMYNRDFKKVNPQKLPLIAVPTTFGTGSHVTQASVVSDSNNVKHTIFSDDFFPKTAYIIPALSLTLPNFLTASTSFDAFCHLSESYINNRYSEISSHMAIEGMEKIVCNLPKVLKENSLTYRNQLAIADAYAGLTLSNGGANIPHTFGELITSSINRINHGQSLAIVYPYFIKSFFDDPAYREGIRGVLEIVNDQIPVICSSQAIEVMTDFLDEIGMSYNLSEYKVTPEELNRLKSYFKRQKKFQGVLIDEMISDLVNERIGE